MMGPWATQESRYIEGANWHKQVEHCMQTCYNGSNKPEFEHNPAQSDWIDIDYTQAIKKIPDTKLETTQSN